MPGVGIFLGIWKVLSNWLLQSVDSCLAVNKRVKFLPSARPQEHGVREHRFACAFVVSVPLTEEFRFMDPVDHSSSGSGHAPCASDCMRSGNPPKNPEGWLQQHGDFTGGKWVSRVNCRPGCHYLLEAKGGFKLHRLLLQLFCVHVCMLSGFMSNSLWPHGLNPPGFSAGDSPGKSTGVGCCALFFPTQGSNLHLLSLLHWLAGSYPGAAILLL